MEGSHQLWMWMKRKQILTSHLLHQDHGNSNSSSSSWEERAFAEDAARILGGSTWPPRSYSCNFCKREFRSAQALGGHMNIHRRDRARLKQNLSPIHNNESSIHHQKNNDFKSLIGNHHHFSSSSSSPTNSSIILQKMVPGDEERYFKDDNDYVETTLSVGLTSKMFGQNTTIVACGDKDKDMMIMSSSCKRMKMSNISSSSFLKPCSEMDDLDLELRLGKQQKVK